MIRTILITIVAITIVLAIWNLTLSIQNMKLEEYKEKKRVRRNYMRIDLKNLFRTIALLEAILLLVLVFCFNSKINSQKETIEKQSKKLDQCSYEIKRLKLVEQNFEEEKEYLYECYKNIEKKAERSGK